MEEGDWLMLVLFCCTRIRFNEIAIRLWGHGFTFDRFGSASHSGSAYGRVLEATFCGASRFVTAFSSGVDVLSQRWTGHVNWTNAPLVLIGRILMLLK